MSFVTKLPLLGRNPALRVALLPLSSQRCASRLSAIHQGLNRSERARPQGSSPRKEIRQRPGDDPYLSPEERRRARAVARQNPINYKIRKGKKDITEEPGPPRKSRRARFSDPRDPMGRRSLVKKFQTGQLFDGVGTGYGGDREGNLQHDDFVRQMSGDTRNRSSLRDFDQISKGAQATMKAEAVENNNLGESLGRIEAWKPRRNDGPVSIPYTTAASQFLYGTSAVEAALKSGRRKMYKLYIYRGKGRSTRAAEKDRLLADLARDQGIRVEYLEEASLPMLNKMSESRPHNGHVLEASPLPQLPTTALEEFSEDQHRSGFKLAVGHQSYEEAQINGTSGFVSTEAGSRKPLVMVVDQVLDPGNLGAILRTASFMGVTAVAVSKKGSAPVTPVVLKSSAGAAEALTMLSVDSVEEFLRNSKDNGWKVYAACPPKSDSKRPQIDTIDLEKDDPLLKDPCILLVGSEGEGLPRALRRAANVEISIPNLSGSDVVDSLNVSVATGLLCSAFLRGKAKARGNTASDPGAIF
ncbi:hypothetical protein INS49_012200 [Diaporthe citri]|uniref:uncharacterized protein n=1 Tax=Diaporthe citri TaxID=83186 RepID=UPI001C80E8C9|nr:uncharacterized protein INS49_012200 [Diaporthe citri]KAG6358682.1 hypothetical protein INS49_012200 [Diaporthe citri]